MTMMTTRYALLTDGRFEGYHATVDMATEKAATLTVPWRIERQTTRIGASICTADRGHPEVQILEAVVVATGPMPAEPPTGHVRVTVLGRTMDLPRDLAEAAGLYGAHRTSAADACLAVAFSEGLHGADAAYRAVALIRQARADEAARRATQAAADTAVHAARIERQAAMLTCRARGVSAEISHE